LSIQNPTWFDLGLNSRGFGGKLPYNRCHDHCWKKIQKNKSTIGLSRFTLWSFIPALCSSLWNIIKVLWGGFVRFAGIGG
jgi:hypothetical protein